LHLPILQIIKILPSSVNKKTANVYYFLLGPAVLGSNGPALSPGASNESKGSWKLALTEEL